MWFTLQRHKPRASACGHGPSGRDVPCCIDISVRGMTAGLASEHRLVLAVPRRAMPALGARLTRRGQPALRPDIAAGRLDSAAGRASHGADLEVLDPDRVEPAGEVGADLLYPTLSSVGLASLQPGDDRLDPSAPVRPTPTPGELPLQPLQPRLFGGRSRLVEIAQRLLLHRLRPCRQPRLRCTSLSQLRRLSHIPPTGWPPWSPHQPLFQSDVPHVPGMATMPQQDGLLRWSQNKPVPGHVTHGGGYHRQFPEGRDRRYFPALKDGIAAPDYR